MMISSDVLRKLPDAPIRLLNPVSSCMRPEGDVSRLSRSDPTVSWLRIGSKAVAAKGLKSVCAHLNLSLDLQLFYATHKPSYGYCGACMSRSRQPWQWQVTEWSCVQFLKEQGYLDAARVFMEKDD